MLGQQSRTAGNPEFEDRAAEVDSATRSQALRGLVRKVGSGCLACGQRRSTKMRKPRTWSERGAARPAHTCWLRWSQLRPDAVRRRIDQALAQLEFRW